MTYFLTESAFLDHILTCFYEDMNVLQQDNYDWDRFSPDGVDRSNIPYTSLHKSMLLALTRQARAFFMAYQLLEDDVSKKLFLELTRYKLAGHKHVRLTRNNEDYWSIVQQGKNYPCQALEAYRLMGVDTPIKRYELEFEGVYLRFKALQILWPFLFRQYYFERDGVVIKPEKGDHVVDGGASLGDASLAFGASVGPEGMVYVFEILDAHLRICRENIDNNVGVSRFKHFKCGLTDFVKEADRDEDISDQEFDFGFELDEGDPRFAFSTIDHLIQKGELDRVDFIKMDIEGSELRALRGAEESLRRFKPKLAISLYHKIEDFYEIPLYLDGLGLGYKFYLDHYTIHVGETVLYAVSM